MKKIWKAIKGKDLKPGDLFYKEFKVVTLESIDSSEIGRHLTYGKCLTLHFKEDYFLISGKKDSHYVWEEEPVVVLRDDVNNEGKYDVI